MCFENEWPTFDISITVSHISDSISPSQSSSFLPTLHLPLPSNDSNFQRNGQAKVTASVGPLHMRTEYLSQHKAWGHFHLVSAFCTVLYLTKPDYYGSCTIHICNTALKCVHLFFKLCNKFYGTGQHASTQHTRKTDSEISGSYASKLGTFPVTIQNL